MKATTFSLLPHSKQYPPQRMPKQYYYRDYELCRQKIRQNWPKRSLPEVREVLRYWCNEYRRCSK